MAVSSQPERTDGRQARWAEHNDERRRRIIEAAIALIEQGQSEASLQQIGERAGLSRSVVYRQFSDRRDLDLAVQRHILQVFFVSLSDALRLEGSPMEIMRRVAQVYVAWAAEHPMLHRLADSDALAGDGPLQQAMDAISSEISHTLVEGFESVGAPMGPADRAATDPLVFGLVGLWFGVVRRWVHLDAGEPSADYLVDLLIESTWPIIELRARAYGLTLDPHAPLAL